MAPELRRARAAGVGAIAEATPIGVGRRADLMKGGIRVRRIPLDPRDRRLPRAMDTRLGPARHRGGAARLDDERIDRGHRG